MTATQIKRHSPLTVLEDDGKYPSPFGPIPASASEEEMIQKKRKRLRASRFVKTVSSPPSRVVTVAQYLLIAATVLLASFALLDNKKADYGISVRRIQDGHLAVESVIVKPPAESESKETVHVEHQIESNTIHQQPLEGQRDRRRKLFTNVLTDAFPFARNPTEFRHQVTFAAYDTEADPHSYVYSKDDLALVLRSLYTLLGFMNMPMWSGSPAYQHFIGTGSCLAKLNRPANEVSIGLLHGIFLQHWHPELKTPANHECKRRNAIRSVLGADMEYELFSRTAIYGNGPQHSCFHVYKDMIIESRNSPSNETLKRAADDIPIHFLLCDEIEEFVGGDISLANNWKRRDESHFDLLQEIAQLIGEPKLIPWIETARQLTTTLYSTTNQVALKAYKELSPRNYKSVYDRSTATFREDANPVEVDRMKFVQDTSRTEWTMLSPYFNPGLSKGLAYAIRDTRDVCDRYEAESTTLDEYILLLESLRSQGLTKCEQNDLLEDDTGFPDEPPSWVRRSSFK